MSDLEEAATEQLIREKGLTAPRITPEHIDSQIESETFTVLPSGKAMVCELVLKNGFAVHGISAVVSVANFDQEIGEREARKAARNQVWPLEAYLLQTTLKAAELRGLDVRDFGAVPTEEKA